MDKIYGHHYSNSAISNMMVSAKTDIQSWLCTDLEEPYPIIYIDATYWHTRRIDSVSNEAYYTVLSVKKDRTREVLTIINHPNEGASNWRYAFESLKQRGLKEVNLIVCEGLAGIENVITEVLPMATVQLCTVHLTRNILAKVKPKDKAVIANEIKAVLNPDLTIDSAVNGYQRFEVFIDRWIKKYPSFKIYYASRAKLYFNYLNYNVQIRRIIYITNWIER